eukprot:559299-Rhodomonas_salina.1
MDRVCCGGQGKSALSQYQPLRRCQYNPHFSLSVQSAYAAQYKAGPGQRTPALGYGAPAPGSTIVWDQYQAR